MGRRGMVPFFFNLGARLWSTPNATPRPVSHAQEPGWSGRARKNATPGFDPRTVQPMASCSTDCAIPALEGYRKRYYIYCLFLKYETRFAHGVDLCLSQNPHNKLQFNLDFKLSPRDECRIVSFGSFPKKMLLVSLGVNACLLWGWNCTLNVIWIRFWFQTDKTAPLQGISNLFNNAQQYDCEARYTQEWVQHL